MNNHTFTDEQLLNLENNTIKTKTEFDAKDFTGGSVQVTSTNNHQLIKYRISLYFGYKGKNPISRTIDINEELLAIWQHAMLLKVKFLQTSNNGMGYSELNTLMNPSNEVVSNIVDSNIVVSKGINTPLKGTLKVLPQSEIDAIEVAKDLHCSITNYNPSFVGDYKKWVIDIERAIRIDKRTKEQLIECICWIYSTDAGDFWIPNIMSGKKLREKFDTMNMQVMKKNNSKGVADKLYENGISATDAIKEMERQHGC